MKNSIIIDSSFLYAVNDVSDRNHTQAMDFLRENRTQKLIPDVILPEVAHLLRYRISQLAVLNLIDNLLGTDDPLAAVLKVDLQRAREIMATYASADFDLVDCCVMALAERLDITEICTFDRRDFAIYRPKHCDYLELLP